MAYQLAAAAIMLAFYGCYFAKLISQRRRSIQTDLLGKGKAGWVKLVEISLKCATYLIVAAEVICICADWRCSPDWLRMVGGALGAIGVGVFILSVREMKDSWRAGVPEKAETELVTGGIYRISRNPAFLGFDLVYIGIVCMFCNWLLCALTAITVCLLHLQIVIVEEPFMKDAFGDKYLAYAKRVRRYIGRKGSKT